MDSLKSLSQGLNPLNLLGGSGGANPLQGTDPLQMLMSLFAGQQGSQQGQDQGAVCSCGSAGGQGGACGCGCSCCQKNQSLGF